MPSVAGIGKHQAGIGLGKIIVAGEKLIAILSLGCKRRTSDIALLDTHVDQALGNVIRDKGNQLRVRGSSPFFQIFVKVKSALDVHTVHRTVQMAVVPVPQLLDAGSRGNFISPSHTDGNPGDDHQSDNHADQRQYHLFPTFHFLLFHHSLLSQTCCRFCLLICQQILTQSITGMLMCQQ